MPRFASRALPLFLAVLVAAPGARKLDAQTRYRVLEPTLALQVDGQLWPAPGEHFRMWLMDAATHEAKGLVYWLRHDGTTVSGDGWRAEFSGLTPGSWVYFLADWAGHTTTYATAVAPYTRALGFHVSMKTADEERLFASDFFVRGIADYEDLGPVVVATPEPGTVLLLGTGLVGLLGVAVLRTRRR